MTLMNATHTHTLAPRKKTRFELASFFREARGRLPELWEYSLNIFKVPGIHVAGLRFFTAPPAVV